MRSTRRSCTYGLHVCALLWSLGLCALASSGASPAALPAAANCRASDSAGWVLFVSPPERGHLNPLLGLAAFMYHYQCRDVAVMVTGDAAVAAVQGLGVPVIPVGGRDAAVLPSQREERMLRLVRDGSMRETMKFLSQWEATLNRLYLPALRSVLSGASDRPPPTAIVADMVLLAALDVGSSHGIPGVLLCPTLSDVMAFNAPFPLTLPYIMTPLPAGHASFGQRLQTLGWKLLSTAVRHGAMYPSISAWRLDAGLPPFSSFLAHVQRLGAAVVVPVLPGVDPARTTSHPALHLVGPLYAAGTIDATVEWQKKQRQEGQHAGTGTGGDAGLEAAGELQRWMGEGPFVYVSLGSLAVVDAPLLLALLHGIHSRGRRSLWARGESLFAREGIRDLPFVQAGIADGSLRLGGYLPQLQVLTHRHASVFVSHAGCGSAHDALAAGVPVLAVPLYGDQRQLASRLEEVGLAQVLQPAAVTPTAVAVRMVVLEDSQLHADAARRWAAITRFSGGAEAASRVVHMVEAAGGARHLTPYDASWPWYRRWALDTSTVAAAALCVVVWGVYACVRCIGCCRCCSGSSAHGTTHEAPATDTVSGADAGTAAAAESLQASLGTTRQQLAASGDGSLRRRRAGAGAQAQAEGRNMG